ncbi:hypothetical protein [Psychromonas ossibalaenae]|uniref:hypothetical protein n=1 Tax=Psychromonas ossibalaenae TaxID=444922 RepID=UPI0003775DCE|nr:hypothetical protein [Psychromonas ossibalaenae]
MPIHQQLLFLILSFFTVLSSAEPAFWDELDNRYTLASRLFTYDHSQPRGDYVNENAFLAYHSYQQWVLAWRADNQIYQAPAEDHLSAEAQFELTELSWSHSFLDSEGDLWQAGKFNLPLDPGYAFQSTAFFESTANPFDDFASSEGINMLSASLWIKNYYLTAVVALAGQDKTYQDKKQWAVIVQRDFDALSSSFIVQQYQGTNPGAGTTFTYVNGESLELHGSAFIRKGSLWLNGFHQAVPAGSNIEDSFAERDNQWLTEIVLGSVWSGLSHQFLAEWTYQQEKLAAAEVNSLYQLSNGPRPDTDNNNSPFSEEIIALYQQRYQQQYLFLQYQYSMTDHTITANSLIGQDQSALSQVKYEYLPNLDISLWLAVELTSGSGQTEFTQIPWQKRLQAGVLWKI